MDEYIKREDALKAIDRVRCEIHKPHEKYVIGELLMEVFDSAFDACDRGINRIPTADVVPKSEVERLVDKWIGSGELTPDEKTLRLIEALRDEAKRYERYYFNHEYDKLISEAKAEVIEEIEERIATHAFTSKSEGYSDGVFDTIAWVDSKLAELKKKYIYGD